MKLNSTTETVIMNGGARTKKFRVKASAAAFKIMTDSLYGQPIRAIARELATNAIDACKRAGKSLGDWELTLPSVGNQVFEVSDHGIGMSDEDMEIYTTLFDSTKSDSNDETGMFGLGAKTPFAYTTQFTVETAKNGYKNVYDIHISEDGCPDCVLLNPKPIPCLESGTKVKFAVKTEDLNAFYEGVFFSSISWPVLPKMINADGFYSWIKRNFYIKCTGQAAFENMNKVFKGSHFKKTENLAVPYLQSSNSFVLEMGSVTYKLNSSYSNPILENVNDYYVIHANIGDVDIQPSREELQYSNKTVSYLNKMIPSVFLYSLKYPRKEAGFKNISKFLKSLDYSIIKNYIKRDDLTDEARVIYDNIEEVSLYFKTKMNELQSILTENFLIPKTGWNYKLEERWDKALYVNSIRNKQIEDLLYTFPSFYGFINLSDKDKGHIKVKNNEYIDAKYFLPKYYSLIKESSITLGKNFKTYGAYIFSDKKITDFFKSNSWFGIDGEAYEFSDLKNTYDLGKSTSKNKSTWMDRNIWDVQIIGSWDKPMKLKDVSYNSLKDYIEKADEFLICPKLRNNIVACNTDLIEKKSFGEIPHTVLRYLNFGTLEKSDKKILILSGNYNAIQSCKLVSLGWKSVFNYLSKDAAEGLKKAIANHIPSVEKYSIFNDWDDEMLNSLKTLSEKSTFRKAFNKYSALYSNFEKNKNYNSYMDFSLFKCSEYSKYYDEIKKLRIEYEDLNKKCKTYDIIKEISPKYPLLELFSYWLAYYGFTEYYKEKYFDKMIDYIKLIDNLKA